MSSMLASDMNNTNFVGAMNPDAALAVRFYNRAVENNFESVKQGRPIFQDVLYVEIFTPGSQLNIIDVPARADHRARFPQQYAHYMNTIGGDQREMGTPLSQWAHLSAAQVEELRGLKFFTVENLANASDLNITNIGMIGGSNPLALREKAKAYLAAAAGAAPAERENAEMAEMKKIMADQQKQISALLADKVLPPAAKRAKAE